jgi:hypothetical protein
VVAPDQEADHGDAEDRIGHEAVAEHRTAREARDDLAGHAHRRQHHDVDRRVRVEPEQVLEQQRVAAQRRVEDPDLEQALDGDQHQRHRQDRRRQHQDQRGRVVGPHEQRQAEPAHAGRAHGVHGDDEIQARQDRREAGHHHAGQVSTTCEFENIVENGV